MKNLVILIGIIIFTFSSCDCGSTSTTTTETARITEKATKVIANNYYISIIEVDGIEYLTSSAGGITPLQTDKN